MARLVDSSENLPDILNNSTSTAIASAEPTTSQSTRTTNVIAETPPSAKRRRTLEEKLSRERVKHLMRKPCKPCAKNCITLIDQQRRIQIYLEFFSISYNERKNFLDYAVVIQQPVTAARNSTRPREVI